MSRPQISFVLLVVAAMWWTSGASAANAPTLPAKAAPRSVAAFACPPHPANTVDIEACESRQLLRLDRRFNREVSILWALLDPTGRKGFAQAHRAWLRYR